MVILKSTRISAEKNWVQAWQDSCLPDAEKGAFEKKVEISRSKDFRICR
jgi:hypothetical protein